MKAQSALPVSNTQGDYSFLDVKAGRYSISVVQPGFEKWSISGAVLSVQQQLRIDAALTVGSVDQVVNVSADAVTAIDTDSPTISGTFSSKDVTNLPVNTRASAAGTSAYNIVGSLPGVQADGSGNSLVFSVQGGLPFQSETSVDGITVRSAAGGNRAIGDAFPSSESIAEIRADGVLNNAEFGQPGQVTVTTKGGTNNIHGGIFWYHQNAAFDAIPFTNPTTQVKPKLIANTFGGSFGGPVVIPHFYDGHNRTFVFGAYEGWRHPSNEPQSYKVPSTLMKQGNFSRYTSDSYGGSLNNPFTGGSYGSSLPAGALSAAAVKLLSFYPDPNVGDPTAYTDDGTPNYIVNKDTSGTSNQFDIRGDQYLGANQKFPRLGTLHLEELSHQQPRATQRAIGAERKQESRAEDQRELLADSFTHQ